MPKKEELNFYAIAELQQRIAEYEDAAAYKKLFFYFFLPLKSFSYSIVKSKEYAEEIVSDVFVEIWAKRRKLMEVEDLKMYTYISVRNASLRKFQQIQRKKILSLNELSVEMVSVEPDAETAMISAERIKKIETAIDQLPPQCKIIFKLAKEDKLKYKEIAQLLAISVKTIDNQLSSALKKIASVLQLPVKRNTAK